MHDRVSTGPPSDEPRRDWLSIVHDWYEPGRREPQTLKGLLRHKFQQALGVGQAESRRTTRTLDLFLVGHREHRTVWALDDVLPTISGTSVVGIIAMTTRGSTTPKRSSWTIRRIWNLADTSNDASVHPELHLPGRSAAPDRRYEDARKAKAKKSAKMPAIEVVRRSRKAMPVKKIVVGALDDRAVTGMKDKKPGATPSAALYTEAKKANG